jgi:hypothetical protein
MNSVLFSTTFSPVFVSFLVKGKSREKEKERGYSQVKYSGKTPLNNEQTPKQ